MADRDALLQAFLASTPWAAAETSPLAGDASNRRYLRLRDGEKKAVLMDAPPEKGEDVTPFVEIANHLTDHGFSAPKVLFQDVESGFLVLEDLGDDLFARVVVASPDMETTLYDAATDVLVDLHKTAPPPNLAPYSPALMAEMAALAYRWYLRGADRPYEAKADAFQSEFETLLNQTCPHADVLIQRDYHAENLLWLPDRDGVARVGLLDFQDALAGHRAYDLVSVLQDARRDVPEAIEQQMIARYLQASGHDRASFEAAYWVLGAQRNLRILGVFARLSMLAGKPHYIDFIPRVWGYLLRDLDHPALSTIRNRILADLPAPNPDLLQRLKDQCATVQTP